MGFNPGAVSVVGNEWRPWQTPQTVLDSNAKAIAVRQNSLITETVPSLMIPYTVSGAPSSYHKLWCDIYNATDLGVNEVPVVYTFVPNLDKVVTGLYYRPISTALQGPTSSTALNISQYIDELTDDVRSGNPDYVMMVPGSQFKFALNSSGLVAGRVLSVTFEVRYGVNSGSDGPSSLILYNDTTLVSTLYNITPYNFVFGQPSSYLTGTTAPIYVNPLTEEPWTRADIISFSTGTGLVLMLQASASLVAGFQSVVAAVRMKVSMVAEKRVAMGPNTKATTPPAGLQTNNFCVLKTPALVANWAKATATNYLIVIRRLDDPTGVLPSATTYLNGLDSGVANPHNQGHAHTNVTINGAGQLITTPVIATAGYGLIMAVSTAQSAETQPYHSFVATNVNTGAGFTNKQLISNEGSTGYLGVRFPIGIITVEGATLKPTATLIARVKRQSDNVQMGGDATIDVAGLAGQTFLGNYGGISWYDVQINFGSTATLVSGTQYYIEFSSASPTNAPWYQYALNYLKTHSLTGDTSYQGATDFASIGGVSFTGQADLAATINTGPPTAPASITVTTVNYALPTLGDPLRLTGVHAVARIAWAATADGVIFARYEVQRSEDGGVTWVLIKRQAVEATVTFDDVEALHGVAVQYRVREVRVDGSSSAWRTQTGTVTLAVNVEAVVFCTNSAVASTTGFQWLGGTHDYRFVSDTEVNIVSMHGRDNRVVFKPLEDRGVERTIPLLIYTLGEKPMDNPTAQPPGGPGAAAFTALRAIAASTGPYVCVHTPDGVRIFGALRVPAGHRVEPAHYYSAEVTVIQVATVPVAVD